MKELIEHIAKALVDHPEQVSVNVLEGSQATCWSSTWPRGTWAR